MSASAHLSACVSGCLRSSQVRTHSGWLKIWGSIPPFLSSWYCGPGAAETAEGSSKAATSNHVKIQEISRNLSANWVANSNPLETRAGPVTRGASDFSTREVAIAWGGNWKSTENSGTKACRKHHGHIPMWQADAANIYTSYYQLRYKVLDAFCQSGRVTCSIHWCGTMWYFPCAFRAFLASKGSMKTNSMPLPFIHGACLKMAINAIQYGGSSHHQFLSRHFQSVLLGDTSWDSIWEPRGKMHEVNLSQSAVVFGAKLLQIWHWTSRFSTMFSWFSWS